MQCGNVPGSIVSAFCVFIDTGAFGFIYVVNNTAPAAFALSIRNAIEKQ